MKKVLILVFTLIQITLFCQVKDEGFIFTDTIHSKYLNKNEVIPIYLPPNYYLKRGMNKATQQCIKMISIELDNCNKSKHIK